MTLVQHLRELRSRVVKAALAVAVGTGLGFLFWEWTFNVLTLPFRTTVAEIAEREGLDAQIIFDGVLDPFTVPLKISFFSGLLLACPIWIYQLWAFVTPGLHRNERKWGLAVMLTAAPLFLGGIAVGYWLLPKGLQVILSFTPQDVGNYVRFTGYLDFVLRLLFIFGLGFLLPVFVVLLNAVGLFSGRRIAAASRWVLFGIFIFAAVATPTGDPLTMLALALPMSVLFGLALLVCLANDRRRARRSIEPDYDAIGDDETSALEPAASRPGDTHPSHLDDVS